MYVCCFVIITFTVRCCVWFGSGAGYHSPANCELYKQVCRHACLQVGRIHFPLSGWFTSRPTHGQSVHKMVNSSTTQLTDWMIHGLVNS